MSWLVSLLLLLLLLVASASAKEIHVFDSSFAAHGEEPSGLAVEEATIGSVGDVYVVDRGSDKVVWFSPGGEEVRGEFTGEETPAGSFSEPTGIAIDSSSDPLDPSRGDVYVADVGHNVIDKFEADGKYAGQIATGANGQPLGEIFGVAVDESGDVWVYQASGQIDRYSDEVSNALLSSRESPFEGTAPGFAVDAHEGLYVNRGALLFAKLSASGTTLIEAINPEEDGSAAAVDTSDEELYIDEQSTIGSYDTNGNELERFGAENGEEHLHNSHGVAVDIATDVVYATNREGATVSVFTPVVVPDVSTGEVTGLQHEGTATLTGTVNPDGLNVISCVFEYGTEGISEHTAPCEQAVASGTSPVAVSANISGLEVARYRYRLRATNVNGESNGREGNFVATTHPTITAEAMASVGASSATIVGKINPGGASTEYYVEYTADSLPLRTATFSVGTGLQASGVQVDLDNLAPETLYSAYLVAINERGETKSAKLTFTTPSIAKTAFTPPDGRAYELVSGVASQGEVYVPSSPETVPARGEDILTEVPMQAAANGEAIAYVAEAGETGGNGHGGRGLGNEFLAVRTDDGWQPDDITPPAYSTTVAESNPEYEAFSSDLTVGVFSASAKTLPEATPAGPPQCEALYARTATSSEANAYHALFTSTQTPGSCGHSRANSAFSQQNMVFTGGNSGTSTIPPYSMLLFQTPAALIAGAEAAPATSEGNNLYESVDGQLSLISVLPSAKAEPDATFGAASEELHRETRPDLSNVISDDGSRVFWTDLDTEKTSEDPSGATRLFAREEPSSPTARTVELDAVEGGPGTSGGGRFWTASNDGSTVFFTDCSRLTANSTAVNEGSCSQERRVGGEWTTLFTGNDLYEYRFLPGGRHELHDLTVDHATDPLGANVQGVIGTSSDGEYVYFVASGDLAPGAEDRICREPVEELKEKEEKEEVLEPIEQERLETERIEEEHGRLPTGRGCNLYVEHDGTTTFIDALAAKDNHLKREHAGQKVTIGDWQAELGSRTAEVTPSGKQVVFESTQQLTGYDNSSVDELILEAGSNAFNQERALEVFVYNTEAPAGEQLACASCAPTAVPPTQEENLKGGGTYLPPSLSPTYMRRWINEEGTEVFFDSSQPLVSQDSNGTQDVYEWERVGTASCPVATSKFGGCIFLLSGGDSSDFSFFVDASANGENVFFTHRGALGEVSDLSDKTVLYDARVGGGFSKSSNGCSGAECEVIPPVAPSPRTPSTLTFNGVGNFPPLAPAEPKPLTRAQKLAKALKACRAKANKRKRKACEAQARKKYGPIKGKGKAKTTSSRKTESSKKQVKR